ncbi:amino acid adenylation domain-containing protein [Amycolatopsis rhizosphaerae]|uniref:Amino acid adenylation domain-containing protein n=1 Tax=Amycolatopsis rhizosphaerae TaxID=2053003 RepID=A0A558CYK3_9PSEU|nr:non-ribosomal peptide synthetase [Amycolatopsis rhizosphaerae]TVT53851.1 amino acid adenylation domain-containing protein [Amycolatopsis rhizosphaerae]
MPGLSEPAGTTADAKERLLARLLAKKGIRAPAPDVIPARGTTDDPPLSFAQQRLWFLDRMEPGQSTYNVPTAARLGGPLWIDALRRGVRALAERHESLRTTFAAEDGQPRQVIAAAPDVPVPVIDLSGLADAAATAHRLAEQEARQPFDLERGPLLRITVLRLAPEDHVLLLNVHHIVSDGWSSGILLRELGECYVAAREGRRADLPPLPVQYADYAVWQRETLSGERLERELGYWRDRLTGAPPVLDLPTDRPRPPVRTHHGANLLCAWPPELYAAVRRFSEAEGVTVFMTLLAGFAAVLSRYRGQEDIVLGTPIAGRTRPELEGLIGFFVNTLALRIDLTGDPGFRELVARVRETSSGAYAHQELPFERLVDALRPDRELSHHPVVQAVVVLQNASSGTVEWPGLRPLPFGEGSPATTAKFDLTLSLGEASDGFFAGVEYNTDLFDTETIERLMAHYRTLLEGALAEPDRPLGDLPWEAAEAELARVAEWSPAVDVAVGPPLVERFAEWARSSPDRVAVVSGDAQATYGAVLTRASRLAAHLVASGVGADSVVGVFLDRGVEQIVAVVAVQLAGGAYLPIDTGYPPERVGYLLEDSGATVLITDREMVAGVVVVVPPSADGGVLPEVRVSADQLGYVIYTSGSTGNPKGVLVAHRQAARLFDATRDWFGFGPDDVWTLFHSIAFDFSVWELWGALAHGGRLVLVDEDTRRSPEEMAVLLGEQAVTVLNQTPSAFFPLSHTILTEDRPVPALRAVIFGGEALPVEQLADWVNHFGDQHPQLVNMYGITETTVHVTHRPLTARDVIPGGGSVIGRPIPDLRVYLLDRRLRPVPPGVVGELYVGGAGLARGYLGRPALTAERFIPDPFATTPGARLYRTGDLARATHHGELIYIGRSDQQVKIRGYRIEPGEIETALRTHPDITAAAVLVHETTPGNKRLTAYLQTTTNPDINDIRQHVQTTLPPHMAPANYIILDRFPLTTNGKVDYAALPEPSGERTGLVAYTPPEGEIETRLAEVWQHVLHTTPIGRHDNFFTLGGHSLLAVRLQTLVRAEFDVELPLRVLFETPDLAALAAEFGNRTLEAATAVPLVPLVPLIPQPRTGPLPLSFAQQRLWFLEQWQPGTPLYHIAGALRLTGALDVPALRRSCQALAERHESLRTHLTTSEGQTYQAVSPPSGVELPIVDLGALDAAERPAVAERLVQAVAEKPFALTTGPLWRTVLLRLGPAEHLLALSLHHLVADGHALELLFAELGAGYGHAPVSGPSPVQYGDYAVWQRKWLESEQARRALAYWREQLAGLDAAPLPTDLPRPPVQTHTGAIHQTDLPATVVAGLNGLAARANATPFMALFAATSIALGQTRARETVVLGTPVANRTRPELQDMIGCLVNTLALRLDLGCATFADLLDRARTVCLGAYDHAELPFERVVQEVQPERSASHLPLFQVWFVVQDDPPLEGTFPGLDAAPVGTPPRMARYDLRLEFRRAEDSLRLVCEYKTDLFTETGIARLTRHLVRVLESVVEDPAIPLGELAGKLAEADEEQHSRATEAARTYSADALKRRRRTVVGP